MMICNDGSDGFGFAICTLFEGAVYYILHLQVLSCARSQQDLKFEFLFDLYCIIKHVFIGELI